MARAPFLSLVATLAGVTHCDGESGGSSSVADAGQLASDAGGPGETEAGTNGADAAIDGGEVCQDDDGIVPSCDGIAAAMSTCSASTCRAATLDLKSRLARREIDCIKTQIRLGTSCDGCRRVALDTACSDSTVDAICATIVADCAVKPGYDGSKCAELASGMTFGARQRFIDCATEGGCSANLADCARPR